MISEPTNPAPGGDASGEAPTGADPGSAGPHDPGADHGGWPATVSADKGRGDRVPDQDEIPAQINPNAMAKAKLRKDQAH
jgi:hypothetical protein